MMRNVLLSLATSLQADIVANWLSWEEVARLDSAICSQDLREAFLQTMCDPGCIIKSRILKQAINNIFVDWVKLRSARITTLSITASSHRNLTLPSSLRELHIVDLSATDLVRVLDQVARTCPHIFELHIVDSCLLGVSLKPVLTKCTALKHLNLCKSSFDVSETMKSVVLHGTNLEGLNLSGCDLLGSLSGVVFPENSSLQTLIVAYQDYEARNVLLPFVLQCTALRVLCLEDINMTDMHTIAARNPQLTSLSFSVFVDEEELLEQEDDPDWNPIMEAELAHFLPLVQNLCALHIWCRNCGSAVDPLLITDIILSSPNVRMLALTETTELRKLLACTPLSPLLAPESAENTPRLEYLLGSIVDEDELPDLVEHVPLLTHLVVTDCGGSWGGPCHEAFQTLASSNFHTLELYDCRCVLDRDLALLHDMQSLLLHDCCAITDAGILAFAAANPALKELRLRGCVLLTLDCLTQLVRLCTHLEHFQFDRALHSNAERQNEFDMHDATFLEETDLDRLLVQQARAACPSLKRLNEHMIMILNAFSSKTVTLNQTSKGRVLHTQMIALDLQSIESQHLRLVNLTRSQKAGFTRVFNAIQTQITAQKKLLVEAGSIRSKRRTIIAKRKEIISKLNCEADLMGLGADEMNNLANDYDRMRYHYARSLTEYVQYTEERMAVQKEKVMLRMTGFAKNVIDDIREEESLARNNKSHGIIFMLQTCTLKLASDSVLPRLDHADTLFKFMEFEELDPIVLFNALQLLDMLCSQNWNAGKANARDEQRQIVHKFLRLIPYTFTFIRTWSSANYHLIPIFVSQLFQTLKAVLSILQVLGSQSAGPLPDNTNAAIHNNNSASSTKQFRDVSMSSSINFGSSLNFGHSVSTASNDNSSAASEHSTHHYTWTDPSFSATYNTTHSNGTTSNNSTSSVPVHYTDEDLAADVILWLKTLKYAKLGYYELPYINSSAHVNPTTTTNTASGSSVPNVSSKVSIVNSAVKYPDAALLDTFCKADLLVRVREFSEVLYGNANTQDSSNADSSRYGGGAAVAQSLRQHVVKELRVLVPLGSALSANIIQCAESVAHILVSIQNKAGTTTTAMNTANNSTSSASSTSAGKPAIATQKSLLPSVPVFGTTAHAVLLAALELGRLSTGRYCIRLGPQGCATGIANQHIRFLRAVDTEIGAVLHTAMAAFSFGLVESVAFEVLQHGYELAAHRCNSYFFVSAWLQCTLAAALLCVEMENTPEEALYKANKEILNNFLRYEHNSPKGNATQNTAPNTQSNKYSTPSVVPLAKPLHFPGMAMRPPPAVPLAAVGKNLSLVSKLTNPILILPVSTHSIQKQELVNHLSEGILRIMAVTAHLRHLLSIVHPGLMIVRLLTRDLFIKRLRIEELMEQSLLTLLIPMLDLKTAMGLELGTAVRDPDDPTTLPEASIQDLTLEPSASNPVTPEASLFEMPGSPGPDSPTDAFPGHGLDAGSSIVSADSSMLSGLGMGSTTHSRGGSRGASSIPTPEAFWKDWVAAHLEAALTGGDGYPSHHMSFVSLLQYVGETHLQSREVIEQLLLLVDHLANKTQVCKFQLVDNGLPLVVQRIVASQSDNVYMIALSELCADALEVKI